MYALLKFLMRLLTRTVLVGIFEIRGAEKVPRRGPLLVCPNHSSTVDPPMVPAFLPRPDTWSMAKAEYFRSPLLRLAFIWYHSFPVVRHTADRKAIRRAREILASGQALVIYPEGTRVRAGGLKEAEPGAGFLALVTQAPVLPVALVGTREVFPPGARIFRRKPVSMRYGRPFRVRHRRSDGGRVTHDEASAAVMLAIAELLPPELRGVYSDLEELRSRLGDLYDYVGAGLVPPVEA